MADYTPTLGDYTELKPFRFWCQKVLPLVYDDTLSYYELLCKVVDYLNKTMEDVDTLHGDVVNLHSAYVQLQDYVNTYFDNLDVQEEINNKLDDMVESGTMSLLLAGVVGYSGVTAVASSDDFTDHAKIYVLMTDGYMYYWNGSAWTKSGLYYPNVTGLINANTNLINATNVASVLTNGKLSSLTGNTFYVVSSSALSGISDLPTGLNTTFSIVTFEDAAHIAIQIIIATSANLNFSRLIYNYNTTPDPTPWTPMIGSDEYNKKLISSNTDTVTSANVSTLLPNGVLSDLPVNSYYVFGATALSGISDLPDLVNSSFSVLTLMNNSGIANQVLLCMTGSVNYNYARVIFNYNATQDVGAWMPLQSINDITGNNLNANYPVLNSTNITTLLPASKLEDAPYNSILCFSSTGASALLDIPNTAKGNELFALTSGKNNVNNVYQIIYSRNGEAYFRLFYDYKTQSPSASAWFNLSHPFSTKKWCFFGDSLCYRAASGFGFPNALNLDNYKNCGVAQATMAYRENSIPAQIDAEVALNNSYDYIMIEGGWNDWYGSTIGSVPSEITTDPSDITRTTACGGLEYSIVKLMTSYPSAKLYYLAVHQIGDGVDTDGGGGETFREMTDKFIQICQMYGVEVIDCFHDSGLNTALSEMLPNTTSSDGIHPTLNAFKKFYRPVILKHINNC